MQMKRRIDTQKYDGVGLKMYTCNQAGTHATLTKTYVCRLLQAAGQSNPDRGEIYCTRRG